MCVGGASVLKRSLVPDLKILISCTSVESSQLQFARDSVYEAVNVYQQ